MGSPGHLELILTDGTVKRAEVYSDGPTYVVSVLQELAIQAGREKKSIVDLDLQRWFDDIVNLTRSNAVVTFKSPSAIYCTIEQRVRKINVDSSFVYDSDETSADKRRLVVDLENPHNRSGFGYDPKSLKAALKVLVERDTVFWTDGRLQEEYYSDRIDSPVPFMVQRGELLLVNSIRKNAVLFEFDGENFNEREYNK